MGDGRNSRTRIIETCEAEFLHGAYFPGRNLARGDIDKLNPEDPQKSRLQGKEFEAKIVVLDDLPDKPLAQLYRAWRNPRPKTKTTRRRIIESPPYPAIG